MSLNADLHSHSFERGVIADKLAEYYSERLDIVNPIIDVEHRDMNRYAAIVTYVDRRLGTVKAHYVVALHDGWRIEFL